MKVHTFYILLHHHVKNEVGTFYILYRIHILLVFYLDNYLFIQIINFCFFSLIF